MKRPALVLVTVTAVALMACGGEKNVPLTAAFPLGPKQLRRAILERHLERIGLDAEVWPESAEPRREDLVLESGVVVDFSKHAADIEGASLRFWPAVVRVDADASPLSGVELFLAPGTARSTEQAGVYRLARGALSALREEHSELVWTERGPAVLADALQGGLEGQEGRANFTLFVRARAEVELAPGNALPSEDEHRVVLEIPVRFTP